MDIDINFNFYSDTPKGKDPDSYSSTLRNYHRILWSRELPNGSLFKLDETISMRLHHKSELGEFVLSSDSIAHTYSNIKCTTDIVKKIDVEELEKFVSLCSTIGGYIIFPSERINNQMTINGARGVNKKIRDRFDLTLECIRKYYKNEDSPLNETFERYKQFFNLFESFKGYVDFFLLQDLVTSDYLSIKYFVPFVSFEDYPLPKDIEEYKQYKYNLSNFVSSRSQRMKDLNK
ncbi:hypothetical protein N9U71_01380 [Candidatus Pelagibacter sp.]|nr:hypothetical protein [Candidatus Pelagibacter sp.]